MENPQEFGNKTVKFIITHESKGKCEAKLKIKSNRMKITKIPHIKIDGMQLKQW